MLRKSLVTLILVCACRNAEPTAELAPAAVHPAAKALHAQLFQAADSGDVQSFAALLSRQSVAMLDKHFAQLHLMERPEDEQDYGWGAFLKQMARLPDSARTKTPFPVVTETGGQKLDISGHPDAAFFSITAKH
jgi:hypothetical protein